MCRAILYISSCVGRSSTSTSRFRMHHPLFNQAWCFYSGAWPQSSVGGRADFHFLGCPGRVWSWVAPWVDHWSPVWGKIFAKSQEHIINFTMCFQDYHQTVFILLEVCNKSVYFALCFWRSHSQSPQPAHKSRCPEPLTTSTQQKYSPPGGGCGHGSHGIVISYSYTTPATIQSLQVYTHPTRLQTPYK